MSLLYWMNHKHDLVYVLILFGLAVTLFAAYGVKVLLRGKSHYKRVDDQGASALLSKSMMEMGYWGMQPLAKFLIACRLSPNALSWLSLLFGALAGFVLAFGHFGFGAFFACWSAVLDSLDGMVARLTGRASDSGEVLDATIDRYVEFFFLAGLMVYYRELVPLLLLALAAMVGSFMVSYSTAKAEALGVKPPKGVMRRPERAIYLILGAVLSPITIPWLEVDRPYGLALGHPMIFALALVAILSNLSAIERLWAIAQAVKLPHRAPEVQAVDASSEETPATQSRHP